MPDRTIVPIKYREDAHETRPAGAGLGERLQVLRPRIAPTVSHYDGFDTLLIDQAPDLTFEVCRVELDAYAIPRVLIKQKLD